MAKKGKKNTLKIDFSNVESGGKCPDGQFKATVKEITTETSDSSGADYLKVKLEASNDATLYTNLSLQPQALWKMRDFLEACGRDVPKKAVDIDLDDIVGDELGVIVENEVYQGKRRPNVTGFMLADEVDESENEEEEEEEEEEAPKAKGKKKEEKAPAKSSKKTSKKEEEEEEESEEEEEEEEAPKKSSKKSDKKSSKKSKDEEEEEEEEEEEAPKSKKKSGGKSKFAVGDKVEFEDDGDEYTGKVTEVDGDAITVKVGKDEWQLEPSDLTKV
jgi:DNA mismatch repair ATPase MutL